MCRKRLTDSMSRMRNARTMMIGTPPAASVLLSYSKKYSWFIGHTACFARCAAVISGSQRLFNLHRRSSYEGSDEFFFIIMWSQTKTPLDRPKAIVNQPMQTWLQLANTLLHKLKFSRWTGHSSNQIWHSSNLGLLKWKRTLPIEMSPFYIKLETL